MQRMRRITVHGIDRGFAVDREILDLDHGGLREVYAVFRMLAFVDTRENLLMNVFDMSLQ